MNKGMFLLAAVSAMSFVGCVSYKGLSEPGDDLADEANQAFARTAQEEFVKRLNAPARPVVIKEAPGMNLFLAPTTDRVPTTDAQTLCQSLVVRKELSVAFKSQLREKVAGIKDFKLIEDATPVINITAEGEAAVPQNYLMTYNITSIELRENAVGSLATGLGGRAIGGGAGRLVAGQKFWDAIAQVEVRLFKPGGVECIFSFVGEGRYRKMVDENNPLSKDLLLGAVKAAANNAMEGYVVKFGPPIFVTDTCQNGQFARLSVGAKFGVVPNQKVEFYRNKVRQGVSGEAEVARQVVGTGVIGVKNAPVEDDGAWVLVNDYDEKRRTVFRWTFARILPAAKK